VRIALRDGRELVSSPAQARGGPENPLSGAELAAKYHALPIRSWVARGQRVSRRSFGTWPVLAASDALVDELLTPSC
jgi:hypothetical protein